VLRTLIGKVPRLALGKLKKNNMPDIYHDVSINAEPKIVFAAVSDPQKLEDWWPLRCSGKPELGARYNFFFEAAYDWYGEVSKCNPGQAFHIKMTQSDADWDPTTFGFDLEKVKEGTLLRFFHKDWPATNHHFRHSAFCWAILLKGLKEYVEEAKVIPFAERS